MRYDLVRGGERAITGIAMTLVGGWNKESYSRLANSKEAYLIAKVDGREELRVPVFRLPPADSMEIDWYDLSQRWLPFERTRFDVPAWAGLRFRLADVPEHAGFETR